MDSVIECGGFVFVHNFDSGNLGHVEQIPKCDIVPSTNSITNAIETPEYEFNVWTRPDCAGTEFENGNRTWFYFGVQSAPPLALVKLNIVNLNRQGKMYSQGMAPVTKTVPGKNTWERIKDRPTYFSLENIFTLSFKYRTPENKAATSYFAFTYPYTYAELQNTLGAIDTRMLSPRAGTEDDIYYCRECVCYSLERRRLDLLTITSRHGITNVREDRLKNLFPDLSCHRPFKFLQKKVIILSARVHPGETPSSFVLNGFLSLLLSRHDPVALVLRRLYVFKLIPFLNPDGVARGQYRTDTRGVNLNRVYLAPALDLHPTIYAARALIRYYHYGFEKEDLYDSSENIIMPPTCESDCNSSDFMISKDFDNPDQENLKSYQTNSKRKKMNETKDPNRRWSNLSGFNLCSLNRPPLQSKSAAANTGGSSLRSKIKVDSEDDTSSSLLITSPTLADQVEDMKLNELQQSMDGFNPTSLDDECAVDHLIKPLVSPFVADSKSAAPDLTSDDDDSVMCGTHPLGDALKLSLISTGGMSVAESLKFSQSWCMTCVKTIKELETRMPGISNMLPARYKDASATSEQEMRHSQCVNCHAALSTPATILAEDQKLKLLGNSTVNRDGSFVMSNRGHSSRDFNKNIPDSPKTKSDWRKKQKQQQPRACPLKACSPATERESGLFLYMDMHGHASKKGIFMYGNHFEELESSVECMLLPRIMALNNVHFHYTSCNFTERNMYLRDRRDGMSREGSGRVAVLKATGLTRSYTLECNYNTGRLVNSLPPPARDLPSSPGAQPLSPPKYTPQLFEEVGRSLGASILDLTGHHPNSRVPNSEHRNLSGLRDWLRTQQRQQRPSISGPRVSASRVPRTASRRPGCRDPERKENLLAETNLTAVRPNSSSRLLSSKFLSARSKIHSDPSFTSKTQRNLSSASMKKPTVSKHSAAFKGSLKSKSPSRRLRLGSKSKLSDEGLGEGPKGSGRSLMESNRINKQRAFEARALKVDLKGQKDAPKQKLDAMGASSHKKLKLRNKEGSAYQKQPAQLAAKPVTKRLKISQFIKYTDNAKEKYRVRKNFCSKTGASSSLSSVDDGWDSTKDLGKLATHKFV